MVKNMPANTGDHKRCRFDPWVRSLSWKDPLEEGKTTHSRILTWRTHGQRSLVGYSPWGLKESDTTERLTHSGYEKLFIQSSDSFHLSLKKKQTQKLET